jgi:hypothetical protein
VAEAASSYLVVRDKAFYARIALSFRSVFSALVIGFGLVLGFSLIGSARPALWTVAGCSAT